jgi:hypothetical protein
MSRSCRLATELLALVRELDVRGDKWLSAKTVAPLFIPRPRVVFGKRRNTPGGALRVLRSTHRHAAAAVVAERCARSAFVEELIHPAGRWRCEMEAAYEQVVLNQEK